MTCCDFILQWRRVYWARSGLCPIFNPPKLKKSAEQKQHSKVEEQEEPKSLPPDAKCSVNSLSIFIIIYRVKLNNIVSQHAQFMFAGIKICRYLILRCYSIHENYVHAKITCFTVLDCRTDPDVDLDLRSEHLPHYTINFKSVLAPFFVDYSASF